MFKSEPRLLFIREYLELSVIGLDFSFGIEGSGLQMSLIKQPALQEHPELRGPGPTECF